MLVDTVYALGSFVRAQRQAQGLTQAALADRLEVSRDWVIRLEQGHPRLEAQRVLDALVALGVTLDLTARGDPPAGGGPSTTPLDTDPFAYLTQH